MAKASPQRVAPSYRPFRAAAYALYLVVVVGFCLVLIHDVVVSVRSMSPGLPRETHVVLSLPECAARVERLWDELEAKREALGRLPRASHAEAEWTGFRVRWLNALRQDQAQCGLDSPDRAALDRAYHALEHVERLYTTSAVQYGAEIGPAVDRLRARLAALR